MKIFAGVFFILSAVALAHDGKFQRYAEDFLFPLRDKYVTCILNRDKNRALELVRKKVSAEEPDDLVPARLLLFDSLSRSESEKVTERIERDYLSGSFSHLRKPVRPFPEPYFFPDPVVGWYACLILGIPSTTVPAIGELPLIINLNPALPGR